MTYQKLVYYVCMDLNGAKSIRIDYHLVTTRFINEKLQPRIASNAYSEETLDLLRRLEWELSNLIGDQWYGTPRTKEDAPEDETL